MNIPFVEEKDKVEGLQERFERRTEGRKKERKYRMTGYEIECLWEQKGHQTEKREGAAKKEKEMQTK